MEKADSYTTLVCSDPACGLHIIAHRKNGSDICELVIGRNSLKEFVAFLIEAGLVGGVHLH